ncbi:MAG TPA: TonB family protein [Puia sp.]|nr:TonB family protein [Puia sp.]
MEANQIRDAHILDILFEGRNKEYGAYQLRKTYNRRLKQSLFVLVGLIGLLFLGDVVAGHGKRRLAARTFEISDDTLARLREEVKPPVVPPIKVQQPQVATIRAVTTRIVPDNQVKPDEKPPENDQMDDRKIGLTTHDGAIDDGIEAPPANDGVAAGAVAQPKKADADAPFMKVEVEAEFPGGIQAWIRFLEKNLHVPDEATNNGIQGTVIVQFIVDRDGNVSDVQAISGPQEGGLREEAVRVIKKSGKWIPALQNGQHVKAYRLQPVTFKVESE